MSLNDTERPHAEVIPESPQRQESGGLAGLFHPLTGLIVLGLDWAIFGGNAATLGLGMAFFCMLGFSGGFVGTMLAQRLLAKDSWGASLVKGFVGGLVVGIPLPVAGTTIGGLILTLTGLDAMRSRPMEAAGEVFKGSPRNRHDEGPA